jgi:hypothetical protein
MKTIEIKLLTKLNKINIALLVAAQIIPTAITQDIELISVWPIAICSKFG